MKNILAGVILLILISTSFGANLSGYVADEKSGETIIGVNVIVEGTHLGTSTDMNGFFVIHSIPQGNYTIKISHIAYTDKTINVQVYVKNLFLHTIPLKPTTLEGKAVTITANRGNLIKKDMDIASFEVDPEVLREVPQMGKDVFKLVQYSPSVTISDPISPLYYVRGSDPGENLVQLDGMTIYNPQHMWSLEAIFNPYAIKNIEMLVGGFDAEFGGRNSSILYITSREGHKDEIKGEFKPSTSGIQGAVEFPAIGNGTAMISGRTLTDIISRIAMGMPNVMADFNCAYQTMIGNTKLRFSAFYARDYIDYDFLRFGIYFSDPAYRNYSTGFLTSTSNQAAGIHIRSILSPNLVAEGHIYYSGFDVKNKNFFRFTTQDTVNNVDIILNYETDVTNAVSDFTTKGNLSYFTFQNQTIKLGFEQNLYTFSNSAGNQSIQSSINKEDAVLMAIYLQDKIEVGTLSFKFGLRRTRLSLENRWRNEPRISMALKFGSSTLKSAWGTYYQYITAMNTQDVEISQFLDYYYPLLDREPLTSIHYILGLEGKLSGNLNYSISSYYKDLKILYRFDYHSSSSSVYAYKAGLEKGYGLAYGTEILIKGNWNQFSGWVSYSISKSTRSYLSIQNGEEFLYDGDQTHNLKALILYKITKDITASTTFKLTSGFPRTWETGNINHYSYDPVNNTFGVFPEQITPVKNNVRYPARIIWEIGLKKKLRSGFGYRLAKYIGSNDAWFTMSVKNLLFLQRNPYMYVYIPDYGYYGIGLSYFPTINVGYSIKF
ncbi:MAG: TonB-dependent receptor [Candidatus Marinimicrobia bacterium]|nr:TonB-dependent receptor [Candidatus Neomarinimicrobiota bacterium]MBL7046324.1 TonB-dependent receptor [Candidatus Neomarinimicrobiota bacterium]